MRALRLFLAAAMMSATAPAHARDVVDWPLVHELHRLAEPCADLGRPSISNPEIISLPDRRALSMFDWMLRLDPVRCPGLAAAAWERLDRIIGTPERPDAPVDYLHLAWRAAREGLGRTRDPALAERYARVAWLYDDDPRGMEVWGEAATQRWLADPRSAALLEARIEGTSFMDYRQASLLGQIRLRRGPGYDPQRALALFVQARDYLSQADLLSSGEHMPPDYRRAGALLLQHAYLQVEPTQRGLIQVGRRAGAAARTPQQHADALRILFAGSVDALDDSCALVRRQLGRLGPVPQARLDPRDETRLASHMAPNLEGHYGTDVDNPAPIRMRALVDATGRVVYVEQLSSSGSSDRDYAARLAWVRYAELVNLAATARGRTVWVELPPIIATRPLQSTTAGWPQTRCG